jgi:hypothetical protein
MLVMGSVMALTDRFAAREMGSGVGSRLRRKTAVGFAVALMTALLAGCSYLGIQPPGTFDKVDNLRDQLNLSEVGTVDYSGHDGAVGDAPATSTVVVSGALAWDGINKNLSALGYKPIAPVDLSNAAHVYWSPSADAPRRSVEVVRLETGQGTLVKAGTIFTPSSPSVQVTIR